MRKNKYKIYANVLLSDDKILFWYTGRDKADITDWYKDFYYAGINQMDYFSRHNMKCVSKAFEATDETNNYIFQHKAPEWYSQWEISEDSRGEPAYKRIGEIR